MLAAVQICHCASLSPEVATILHSAQPGSFLYKTKNMGDTCYFYGILCALGDGQHHGPKKIGGHPISFSPKMSRKQQRRKIPVFPILWKGYVLHVHFFWAIMCVWPRLTKCIQNNEGPAHLFFFKKKTIVVFVFPILKINICAQPTKLFLHFLRMEQAHQMHQKNGGQANLFFIFF